MADQWGCPLGVSWHTQENCNCSAPGEPLTARYVMEVHAFAARQPETTDPRWAPVLLVCESHERLRARYLAANSALDATNRAATVSPDAPAEPLNWSELVRVLLWYQGTTDPKLLAEMWEESAAAPRPAGPTPAEPDYEFEAPELVKHSTAAPEPTDVLGVEQIEKWRTLTKALRSSPMQDLRDAILTVIASHESLRAALASARAVIKGAAEHQRHTEAELASARAALGVRDGMIDSLRFDVASLQAALSEATRRAEDIREIARPFVDALSDSIAHQALRAIFARAALPEETRHG